jgi:hypothetical protein
MSLECDHCGAEAIAAKDLYEDGEGDRCVGCGFPGHIVCDSETDAYWQSSDEGGAYCNDFRCEECGENLRQEARDGYAAADALRARLAEVDAEVAELRDRLDLQTAANDAMRGSNQLLGESIVKLEGELTE